MHGINYHIFYFHLLYYGVFYSRLFIFYHAGYLMWRADGLSLLRMPKTIWCSCNLEYWRLITFYEASKMKEDWWLYILHLVYCIKIYLFLCKFGVIKTFFKLLEDDEDSSFYLKFKDRHFCRQCRWWNIICCSLNIKN